MLSRVLPVFERVRPAIYTYMVSTYVNLVRAAGTPDLLSRQPAQAQPFTKEFCNYTISRFRNSRLQLCGDDMPAVVSLLEQRLMTL